MILAHEKNMVQRRDLSEVHLVIFALFVVRCRKVLILSCMFYSGSHRLFWDINHFGPFETVFFLRKRDKSVLLCLLTSAQVNGVNC